MMIKKSLIFIFLIGFIILSCEREKEEPELNIPPELVGKWKTVKLWVTEGGPHYWMDIDTGCEWDSWFQSTGNFIDCYPCDPHIGNFNVIDVDIIINWENNSCSTDPQSILTIDKLTSDTLIWDWNFWEGGKTMFVKVNDSVSDTCNCQ